MGENFIVREQIWKNELPGWSKMLKNSTNRVQRCLKTEKYQW
jgi:hypothetical protein